MSSTEGNRVEWSGLTAPVIDGEFCIMIHASETVRCWLHTDYIPVEDEIVLDKLHIDGGM